MEAAIARELAGQLAKEIVKRAKIEKREYQYEDMLEFRMEVGVEFEKPRQMQQIDLYSLERLLAAGYMNYDMADTAHYFNTKPMLQIVLADPDDVEGFDADSTDPVDIKFKDN